MLTITLTDEQKVLVKANPVTASGKPAGLDGPLTIAVQSGAGTFVLQGDGLSFYILSGPVGDTSVFTVSGVSQGKTIQDSITLVTVAAPAVDLGLAAGTPEQK